MKKRTRLLIIVAATAMVMAGCSGNQDKNAGDGGQQESVNQDTMPQNDVSQNDVQNNDQNNGQNSVQNDNQGKAQVALSEDEALQIALDDAQLTKEAVTHTRVYLEQDDGVWEYEVDINVGNQEYDYDIDANTGDIRDKDMDIED